MYPQDTPTLLGKYIRYIFPGIITVIYKDQSTLSVQACGLRGHLDGTTTKPMEPAVTQPPANRALTEEEKEKITMYKDDLKEWFQKKAIVSQQVASTILDSLYLKIRRKLL